MSSAVLGMPSAPMPVMTCGKPLAPGMKLPYGVGPQQRHAADVVVGQLDAEHVAAWALTSPQVAMPPLAPSISLPVATGSPAAFEHVLAQEHLVRGMRGVGLVLVDEGRSSC